VSLDPITAGLDLLGTVARIIERAQAGEVTPAEAIAAARKALGADPLAGMSAQDAARHSRILAEMAAAQTRVSSADVSAARRLVASPMLTPEESASIGRLADHVAIVVGDSPLAQAVVDHIARTERSDEPTVEIGLPKP
jgi:hypothetical protein